MNLLRYNGPKAEHLFSLMIDYPKYKTVKQCNDSAIGVENPEVLPIKLSINDEPLWCILGESNIDKT